MSRCHREQVRARCDDLSARCRHGMDARGRAWCVARVPRAHAGSHLARRTRAPARARGRRRPLSSASRWSAHLALHRTGLVTVSGPHHAEATRAVSHADRTRTRVPGRLARRAARRIHLDLHAHGSRHRDVRAPASSGCLVPLVASEERGSGVGTALAFARLHHAHEHSYRIGWRLIDVDNRSSQRTAQKTAAESTRVIGELRYRNFFGRSWSRFATDTISPETVAVRAALEHRR